MNRYYADTDSLYIDLADRPSTDSREALPLHKLPSPPSRSRK
jgi:hypothetical protein